MTWRIDLYPPQGLLPQLRIVLCVQAWDRLTPPQRNALLRAKDGRLPADTRPDTLAALVRHGIANEDGSLTDAGQEVYRWRPTRTEARDA